MSSILENHTPAAKPQTDQRSARPNGRRALWREPSQCILAPAPEAEQTSHFRVSENGGAYRDRTDDLMLAKQPLSQLS
jgi:hypothetical protein